MEEDYVINLTGFGIDDHHIEGITINKLLIKRKGDIWNKRTRKTYEENVIRISFLTTYKEGFGSVIDKLLDRLESNETLIKLFSVCKYVELQIWITLDDENRVPSIHISAEQISRLEAIKAHIDISIS